MFAKPNAGRDSGARRDQRMKAMTMACAALMMVAARPAAHAADECGPQMGPTTVVCDQAAYGGGVTYDAIGDLVIDFTRVPTTTVGGNGITLIGEGSENITFDSAATATEIQSSNTVGALLGATTVNGNIILATEEMDADVAAAAVTHAIYAESTGSGSIDITTSGAVDVQSNSGTLANSIGIQAITGSGDLTLSIGHVVTGNAAAIDATTGTGQLTINILASSATNAISRGIRVDTGGSAAINIAAGREVRGIDQNAIRATGTGTLVVNNDGGISGVLDLGSLAGGFTFNNNAGALWNVSNSSVDGELANGTINNAGTISLSPGTYVDAPGANFNGVGSGTLELNRALLNGRGQRDCSDAAVSGCLDLSGGMTQGQTDVLVIVGPSDSTNVFIEGLDRPISPGIVVVDVGGGQSTADHFVLHPDSYALVDRDPGTGQAIENVPIYATDPVYGAVLETGGLFDYALLYNPDAQQHLLASVPNAQGIEYVGLIHEAVSVWHASGDVVAGRQADLRDGGDAGGWIRLLAEQSDRQASPELKTHGNQFTFDQRSSLYTGGVVAGYDLTADSGHVFGVHLGFMSTRQEYEGSQTIDETRMPSSVAFGVYGGWWTDAGLTIDGALNVNLLDIEHGVRKGLETNKTNVLSMGARLELGWRLGLLGEALYVQPLASASHVMADIENLNLRDYDARYKGTESSRAALGVRVGGKVPINAGQSGRVGYWVSARAGQELADAGRIEFEVNDGDNLVITDDLSGSFQEYGLGISVSNADDSLGAFLSGGAKTADDLDSYNVSLGARMRW